MRRFANDVVQELERQAASRHQEKNMKTKRTSGTLATIAAITFMVLAYPVAALEANKSNLWFGGDEGIEIVTRTGKNLAYTAPHAARWIGLDFTGSRKRCTLSPHRQGGWMLSYPPQALICLLPCSR
jgi:hypothetical protein